MTPMHAQSSSTPNPLTDDELIKHFPGFTNNYLTVNGVNLHYVEGGHGKPLICLPGWPQTWYSYHSIAVELAKTYHVIIVDIRGMGSSDKPAGGYDKKTMATDVLGLVQQLGLEEVHIMGHDIGGMIAMSFAFNYPEFTGKLVVLDGSHPGEGMFHMPLIPAPGSFNAKMDAVQPYAWWMGFNQVKGLPEKLLEGRFQHLLEWLLSYVMIDDRKMSAFDRSVYAAAYNDEHSIRASNGWYQSFGQDIEDAKSYQQLTMPVLAIGSYISFNYMKMGMPGVARNLELVEIANGGHYLYEEQPEQVLDAVIHFLGV